MPGALAADKITQIRELRRAHSIAEVVAATGISNATIIKHSRGVQRDPCACGRPGGHHGWCEIMLARSPKRQAMLATWIPHNKKWTTAADAYLRGRWRAGVSAEAIAKGINKLLGRADVSPYAVKIRAGKLGVKRKKEYLTRMRRTHRILYWDRALNREPRGNRLINHSDPRIRFAKESAEIAATIAQLDRTERCIVRWKDAMDWAFQNKVPLGNTEEEDLAATNRMRVQVGLPQFVVP